MFSRIAHTFELNTAQQLVSLNAHLITADYGSLLCQGDPDETASLLDRKMGRVALKDSLDFDALALLKELTASSVNKAKTIEKLLNRIVDRLAVAIKNSNAKQSDVIYSENAAVLDERSCFGKVVFEYLTSAKTKKEIVDHVRKSEQFMLLSRAISVPENQPALLANVIKFMLNVIVQVSMERDMRLSGVFVQQGILERLIPNATE